MCSRNDRRLTQALRLTANGNQGAVSIPADHNRVEFLASWGELTAGDVKVYRTEPSPQGSDTVRAIAATLAYSADGARSQFSVGYGAQFDCVLSGLAGTGTCNVVISSWQEV